MYRSESSEERSKERLNRLEIAYSCIMIYGYRNIMRPPTLVYSMHSSFSCVHDLIIRGKSGEHDA